MASRQAVNLEGEGRLWEALSVAASSDEVCPALCENVGPAVPNEIKKRQKRFWNTRVSEQLASVLGLQARGPLSELSRRRAAPSTPEARRAFLAYLSRPQAWGGDQTTAVETWQLAVSWLQRQAVASHGGMGRWPGAQEMMQGAVARI